jgi:hypothetical protein
VGRWATYVAVVIPIPYAVTRWAWALGFPLGISEEFLREGQEVGLWWAGAALAVGGAILTLGLVQRWGEVFPRWIPFLGGKRVPIRKSRPSSTGQRKSFAEADVFLLI